MDELLVDLDLPKNENTVFKNCSPREKEILEELIVAMKPVFAETYQQNSRGINGVRCIPLLLGF